MTLLRNILAASALTILALAAGAKINSLPVKTVNGKQYHYYVVQPKDTIYSLCRSLGVEKAEIERYNPSVVDGLKIGQTLYFPVGEAMVEGKDEPVNAATHIVKDKETLYGISKKYGVTTDQLVAWNPAARDGLRPGQMLIVSEPTHSDAAEPEVAPAPTVEETPDNEAAGTYEIKRGETLYAIAAAHGVKVDDLLALNPGMDRNNYEAGRVINVPVGHEATAQEQAIPRPPRPEASAEPVNMPVYKVVEPVDSTFVPGEVIVETPAANYIKYEVKKRETFYSIARAHGVTVEELENANPTVGILKDGMILNIPAKNNQAFGDNLLTSVENGEQSVGEGNAEPLPIAPEDEVKSVNIALMLPLMLNSDAPSKQAQLYTEFYKGFLLAVDSMRNCGTPIHIQTYDTEGTQAGVDNILAQPELATADVIIAPDAESQLTAIGNWGRAHNVKVLNLFVVRDESYINNPVMMQGNIPHRDMYAKAIAGMTGRFSRFSPVIVTRKDGPDDKAEYLKALKANLDMNGIPYREIEYESSLRASDLADLPLDGSYAFIPSSGRQAELNRIAPALIEFKKSLTGTDPIRLFGYPEWTTFRGETLVNMHALNSLVYSRFYIVPEDPAVRDVEDLFVEWYGAPMANFVPRQGLFGFDTGMYLINALRNGGEDMPMTPYSGVQNGFGFVRRPSAQGWVNDELYFINFRPSGLIDKIAL